MIITIKDTEGTLFFSQHISQEDAKAITGYSLEGALLMRCPAPDAVERILNRLDSAFSRQAADPKWTVWTDGKPSPESAKKLLRNIRKTSVELVDAILSNAGGPALVPFETWACYRAMVIAIESMNAADLAEYVEAWNEDSDTLNDPITI